MDTEKDFNEMTGDVLEEKDLKNLVEEEDIADDAIVPVADTDDDTTDPGLLLGKLDEEDDDFKEVADYIFEQQGFYDR